MFHPLDNSRIHNIICTQFETNFDVADIECHLREQADVLHVKIWGEVDDPMSKAYGRHEMARMIIVEFDLKGTLKQEPVFENIMWFEL